MQFSLSSSLYRYGMYFKNKISRHMYKFNDTKDWIHTWFDYTEQNYFAFSFVEFQLAG